MQAPVANDSRSDPRPPAGPAPRRRGRSLARRLASALPLVLITAVIVAGALAVRGADPSALSHVRNLVFDEYQRFAPRPWDPEIPVRIVAIDEASLDRVGQWPWSRRDIAAMIDALAAMGAAAIALDFVMAEPDRTSPEEIAAMLPPSPEVESLRAALRETPRNDFVLAGVLQAAPSVLGVALAHSEDGTFEPERDAARAFAEPKAGFAFAGDDPLAFLPDFSAVTAPLPVLSQATAGLGAMNWLPDRDQVVRAVPLVFALGNTFVPSLAAEALRVAQGASTYVIRASNASGETAFGANTGINTVRIGAFEVPTNPEGAVRLHFTGTTPGRYVPAWRVLDGSVDPTEIEGRIILVGATAPGLLDLRSTPIDVAVPGVEVHAQLIEHVIAGEELVRPDWAPGLEMVVFVLLATMFAIAAGRLSAIGSIAVGVVALSAVLVGSYLAFARAGLLLDPSFPILASAAVLLSTTGWVAIREESARRSVRRAFSRYVAPELVEELAKDPQRLALGGELRPMTILFTDMRGFTTISEGMNAVELTGFINAFLTPLTDTILANRGTIDKYMGDAIMAFWNAPLDDPDHAPNACEASLRMLDALADFNEENAGRYPHVEIGIGINSGVSCVGNLGSLRRFDYSVIGDDVNVASRLEGQTKNYGVSIIVGPETRASSPSHAFLPVDRVQVKGRDRSIDIFALVGGPNHPVDPQIAAIAPTFEAMVEAYRAGDLPTARERLAAVEAAAVPRLAMVTAMYRERLDTLGDGPLPDGWDGTWRLTSK